MKLSHAIILISAAAMTHAFTASRTGGNAASVARGWLSKGASSKAASQGPSSQLRMSSTSSVESLIQSEIDANEVVVFSKSYCPYCLATKSLFQGLGVPVRVIELDQRPDGGEIQGALLQRTGQRTVPNTFIGGVHLGGNDSAQAAARSGELQKKLGLSSS